MRVSHEEAGREARASSWRDGSVAMVVMMGVIVVVVDGEGRHGRCGGDEGFVHVRTFAVIAVNGVVVKVAVQRGVCFMVLVSVCGVVSGRSIHWFIGEVDFEMRS